MKEVLKLFVFLLLLGISINIVFADCTEPENCDYCNGVYAVHSVCDLISGDICGVNTFDDCSDSIDPQCLCGPEPGQICWCNSECPGEAEPCHPTSCGSEGCLGSLQCDYTGHCCPGACTWSFEYGCCQPPEFSSYGWILLLIGMIAVSFYLLKKRLK